MYFWKPPGDYISLGILFFVWQQHLSYTFISSPSFTIKTKNSPYRKKSVHNTVENCLSDFHSNFRPIVCSLKFTHTTYLPPFLPRFLLLPTLATVKFPYNLFYSKPVKMLFISSSVACHHNKTLCKWKASQLSLMTYTWQTLDLCVVSTGWKKTQKENTVLITKCTVSVPQKRFLKEVAKFKKVTSHKGTAKSTENWTTEETMYWRTVMYETTGAFPTHCLYAFVIANTGSAHSTTRALLCFGVW